jgi:hypothetical protein
MEGPRERLPERRDAILAHGARLKVTLKDGGIEIDGNRKGLSALAAICSGLAELTEEDLRTPANHYHLDEDFWGTDPGSIPLTVHCREDGWPDSFSA